MSGYVALGKYDNARDDALHYLCTSGWANDEGFGNMDFGGYFQRISNTWEEVKPENGEFNSLMEEWFELNPEVEDDSIFRTDLVGHFIVMENDRGFVSVMVYESEADLLETYNDLKDRFNRWDAEEHGED